MRVLVTGGTGFVGRAVVKALAARGDEVRLALRSEAAGGPVESVVVGEIDGRTDWTQALQGVEAVVHLAARVHVMRDTADGAALFHRTNTEGTLRLADACAVSGVRRLVFVSTIKVNGEGTVERAFAPDDQPAALDPYGVSKHDAERGLLARRDLDIVVVRPPLVYGPGVKGNLARLCRLAAVGAPVPFGRIVNRRDLVGVDNLADLLATCVRHPAAAGNVFLAADGEPLSTPQLFALIARAMDRPVRLLPVPVSALRLLGRLAGRAEEVERLVGSLEIDISKTRRVLSWRPPVPTEVGIRAMAIDYLNSRRSP